MKSHSRNFLWRLRSTMSTDFKTITCPSCGQQRAEDGEKYCKLCIMARLEELGLLGRALRDRPANEDKIRGIQ